MTAGTATALAAKQATSVIPIVFATAGNPVQTGLVTSLVRPGGNVTGLSNQAIDIATKRLQLLREAVPRLERLAVLVDINTPIGALELGEVQAAARKIGLQVVALEIRKAQDIAPAVDALKGQAEALYVVNEPLAFTHRVAINTFALAAHLPTMHDVREHVDVGGLMSYGPNFSDLISPRCRHSRQDPARNENRAIFQSSSRRSSSSSSI
jgi:putative ABC transport system substrate-binding protein